MKTLFTLSAAVGIVCGVTKHTVANLMFNVRCAREIWPEIRAEIAVDAAECTAELRNDWANLKMDLEYS